ncbi:MAG TPA: glycosyltransferase, partial [Terriglobales bacterium]|nr:glycosyltransferase [Terriglobales bacterium]
ARAQMVAIVADDYQLAPDYVATVVRFFEERPAAMILRCGMTAAGSDLGSRISDAYYRASILRRIDAGAAGSAWSRWLPRVPCDVTTRHQLEASGAAAFRREVFDRVGMFDESLGRAEDSDLTVRLRRHGIAIHYLPIDLVRHQYHPYLRDTLIKSWYTGWYRYRHYHKNQLGAGGARQLVPAMILGKLRGLAALVHGIRGTDDRRLSLWLALPCVLLFEAVNKAGFVSSWLWARRRES